MARASSSRPRSKTSPPDLRAGDRLSFVLRANAARTRKTGALRQDGKPRTKHVDVVMGRLFPIAGQKTLGPGGISERPDRRLDLAADWLAGQGARAGFALEQRDGQGRPDLDVSDYSVVPLPAHAGRRRGRPQFGVMDLTGACASPTPGRS